MACTIQIIAIRSDAKNQNKWNERKREKQTVFTEVFLKFHKTTTTHHTNTSE